jgi:hypothetical protein
VTGAKAEIMASDQARAEVIAALVPICMEQSRVDPQSVAAQRHSDEGGLGNDARLNRPRPQGRERLYG